MCNLKTLLLPAKYAAFCGTMLVSGCMNPGMYYGNPYSRPVYSPPQAIGNGVAPGTLYIPESDAPPYSPQGSTNTYETDPPDNDDDFNRPNERFFTPDDDDGAGDVPFPPDRNQDRFNGELGGLSTQYSNPTHNATEIQQVSGASSTGEYGFDTKNYRWLRGILKYDSRSGGWMVTYSLAARDQYGGTLPIDADQQQINGLADGDTVDLHGYIDTSVRSPQGRPIYRVEAIERIDI